MKLHAIGGLPRSGSTLLCNILSMRPNTVATSTSCLPGFVRSMSAVASNRIEMKNLLNLNLPGAQLRFARSVRAFCEAWHGIHAAEVIFDKSRGWNDMPYAFRDISPNGVILMCVRDLRDVFASCEREEVKNGLITNMPPSVYARYDIQFADNGVIGSPYKALMTLVCNMPSNILIVRYEDLIKDPAAQLRRIEERCSLEPFDYDFDNIPDLAIDPDGFYLGKYPHRASGKLEPQNRPWQEVVPQDIANNIVEQASVYYNIFYGKNKPQPVEMPMTQPQLDDREMDRVLYAV